MVLEDLVDEDRRQAHRRLVHEQDLGVGHQGPAHGQHLLLAAAEGAGDLALALLEAREHREGLLDARRDGCLVGDDEGAHLQVLGDRQAGEDAPALRDLDDAPGHDVVGREAAEVLAVEQDLAAARPDQPADRVERGALAGTVAADEGHDLALHDVERDALQGVDAAVEGVDVLDRQDGHGVSIRSPAATPSSCCSGGLGGALATQVGLDDPLVRLDLARRPLGDLLRRSRAR